MKLLKSKRLEEVFGGAKGVHFLADPGKFICLFIRTPSHADSFLERLRAVIIAAEPTRALVAGLDTDSELVRTACTDALYGLSQHR